jgi:hypothetical protein
MAAIPAWRVSQDVVAVLLKTYVSIKIRLISRMSKVMY